jgi:type II restriction/modification system DNA methylase subunit YeeA
MRSELGDGYVDALRECYKGRVPGGADLVTYWFEKARAQIAAGKCKAAGLVATNSIRGGANRKVLDRIVDSGEIFEAWADEDWINEGAAVRVSLVCFGAASPTPKHLDGVTVPRVHGDLTAGEGLNLSAAVALAENADAAYQGPTKGGAFDIPGELARQWLTLPNPNGRPNHDVLKPWANGQAVTARWPDDWIIDFAEMPEESAALFELPFGHVIANVKPERAKVTRERRRRFWWQFNEPAPGFRASVSSLQRYIATPEVAKYRVFTWLAGTVAPDKNLVVIARADDVTFGILHSRFHELWSLRLGTSLEDRPRYTSTTTFRTFPFPEHMTPRDTAGWGPGVTICDSHEEPPAPIPPCAPSIAAAAQRLNDLRENWLNPPEWTERVPEIVAGYPDRILAKPGHEAELKKRTLTNLYNARPAWLDNAHKALDAAVAAAYGWTDYTPAMPDDEILRRLLALNLARAKAQAA